MFAGHHDAGILGSPSGDALGSVLEGETQAARVEAQVVFSVISFWMNVWLAHPWSRLG